MSAPIIRTEGIAKSFGEVHALKGIDLEVQEGTVFGLLGPNGAGKTTGVRILTTLLQPDAGRAEVAGYDVVRDAEALRAHVGLAGQSAAIDGNLTGRENLEMVARLYHLPRPDVKRRAGETLERLGLRDAGDRPARTYSGGMRRRLDLWAMIRELRDEGITLLLTTQYLEEADSLTDRIAVIDLGSVIAEGTSDELKDRIGGEVLELHVADRERVDDAAAALKELGTSEPVVEAHTGSLRIQAGTDGARVVVEAVRRLDDAGIRIGDIALHKPTLDDVFLTLTGHVAEQEQEEEEPVAAGRGRKRG